MRPDSQVPKEAVVLDRVRESATVFTLRLSYTDPAVRGAFVFEPGQFHMLYVHGVGEIPLSIVSDPEDEHHFDHTVRVVGRVTRALERLGPGERVGIRGPFGRGWPLAEAQGQDLVLITGGLGCAPLVSVVGFLMRRRSAYGQLTILQGVRHADDMIWRERYDAWARQPDTRVLLAADVPGEHTGFHAGTVIDLFSRMRLRPERSLALICGPEVMMLAAVAQLRDQMLSDDRIWLSMERNMQCGDGLCGHCQIGPWLVCRDGPVFCYADIADLFGARGF
jgi:NAD(P)H-flavin reductase